MNIRARIAGIIEGNPIHEEGSVDVKDGIILKDFLKIADKKLGFEKKKYFQNAFKQGILPTLLLNGDRFDLPDGFTYRLKDGDEISVLLPMSGG